MELSFYRICGHLGYRMAVHLKHPFPLGWILFFGIVLTARPGGAAGGMFPKMPPAPKAYVVDCFKDDKTARMTAWSLQGLVNQSSAEAYVLSSREHEEQLEFCKKPFEKLEPLTGDNPGLRTLFQRYKGRVERMFFYDPDKDWTWYLALMSAAQEHGISVTENIGNGLTSEFGWKGEMEDFRNKWPNRIEAYDWALAHLMPQCSRQVVFALRMDKRLCDYVVASKGFDFWLDAKKPEERAEIQKIYRSPGYGLGTSLMGYAGDSANEISNPYGIGYVCSDFYGNGSFWSSFPNKSYAQSSGKAVAAQPGKIYASIMWSDGDNIQFDEGALYDFWHDSARGTIPIATTLSPALQELNSPLLDWYYAKMTANDELMAGPTGAQFIYIEKFKESLFPAWCELTRQWCRDAGFHSVRIWRAPNPSVKYTHYMKACGFSGVFGEGTIIQRGFPPKLDTVGAWDGEKLFKAFTSAAAPNPRAPVFVSFTPIVQGFDKKGGGYTAVKRQIDRVEATYPGRYSVPFAERPVCHHQGLLPSSGGLAAGLGAEPPATTFAIPARQRVLSATQAPHVGACLWVDRAGSALQSPDMALKLNGIRIAIGFAALTWVLAGVPVAATDLSDVAKTYQPRLQSNLTQNIAGFWYPKTLDQKNAGYILNHDIDGKLKDSEPRKMIVTQSRMVWLFSHLVREGYGGKEYWTRPIRAFVF